MSDNTINGQSIGFYGDNGKWYLIRCQSCGGERGRENYAPAVASGQCAWCGYTPVAEGDSNEQSN